MTEENTNSVEKVAEIAGDAAQTVAGVATDAAQGYLGFEVLGVYAWHFAIVVALVGTLYVLSAPMRKILCTYCAEMAQRYDVERYFAQFFDALPTRAVDAGTVHTLARWHWNAIALVSIITIAYPLTFAVSGMIDALATALHVAVALLVGKALLALNRFRHKRIVRGKKVRRRFNVFFVDIFLRRTIYALTLAYVIGIFQIEDLSVFSWTIPSDWLSLSALLVFFTTVFSPAVLWQLFNRHIGYPGDYITVGDKSGNLIGMTLAHTTLRTAEGVTLIIPNREMVGVVENVGTRRQRRFDVVYEISPHELTAREVAEIPQRVREAIGVLDDVDVVRVRFERGVECGAMPLRVVYNMDRTSNDDVDVLQADVHATIITALIDVPFASTFRKR